MRRGRGTRLPSTHLLMGISMTLVLLCLILNSLCSVLPYCLLTPAVSVEAREASQVRLGALAHDRLASLPVRRDSAEQVEFCIVIPSKARRKDLYYLTRTVVSVLQENDHKTRTFVLDVAGSHEEAKELENHVQVLHKSHDNSSQTNKVNEYHDYVTALRVCEAHVPDYTYVMVLQDDAPVLPGFFTGIRSLAPRIPSEWAYILPYYPLKWQGYSMSTVSQYLVHSLLTSSVIAGLLYAILYLSKYSLTRPSSRLLGLFTLILGLGLPRAIGRANIIRLPQLLPLPLRFQYYSLIPAHGCCIPCAVYPREHALGLASFLEAQPSMRQVDLVLPGYAKSHGLEAVGVEPNMVAHIGMYSSLSESFKDDEEFNNG